MSCPGSFPGVVRAGVATAGGAVRPSPSATCPGRCGAWGRHAAVGFSVPARSRWSTGTGGGKACRTVVNRCRMTVSIRGVGRGFGATGTGTGFRKALDTLAATLEDEPPPVSYSRRRWACADHDLLRAAVDLTRTETAGLPPGLSPEVLAGLTWQTYTGGTLTLHPYLEPAAPPPDLPLEELTRLVRTTAAHLHHLAGSPDSGVLQWQPP